MLIKTLRRLLKKWLFPVEAAEEEWDDEEDWEELDRYADFAVPQVNYTRGEIIHREFKRWHKSHVDWQVIRAANSVLDSYSKFYEKEEK